MKVSTTAKLLGLSLATVLTLTACGGDHEHPKAVDKLAEAEAAAKEKAPQAESVKFEDEGQPTMGGVGGAPGANPAPATTASAATPAASTASAAVATASTAETASAPASN